MHPLEDGDGVARDRDRDSPGKDQESVPGPPRTQTMNRLPRLPGIDSNLENGRSWELASGSPEGPTKAQNIYKQDKRVVH